VRYHDNYGSSLTGTEINILLMWKALPFEPPLTGRRNDGVNVGLKLKKFRQVGEAEGIAR